MITHLTQPTYNSCQATCIAMLYGADEEMLNLFVEKIHPVYFEQMTTTHVILKRLDLVFRRCYADELLLFDDSIYLLSVPSINVRTGMHAILRSHIDDNGKVYDPAQGIEGRRFYISEPNLAGAALNDLGKAGLVSDETITAVNNATYSAEGLGTPIGGFIPEIEIRPAMLQAWRDMYPKEKMIELLHKEF